MVKVMKSSRFWQIVDKARGGAVRADPYALAQQLREVSKDELEGYQATFDRYFDEANTWLLWGAAYLIEGGCSDDGFTDFRYGLVSFGESVFTKAMSNPDTLADVDLDGSVRDEGFGYVALQVYEARFGAEMPRNAPLASDMGVDWDFDDEETTQSTFPRLYARFGA